MTLTSSLSQTVCSTVLFGTNSFNKVSSSNLIGSENDPLSDMEDNIQQLFSDRDILECEGVPRHLKITKCVSLHNDDEIVVGEGSIIVSNQIWLSVARDHLGTHMLQSIYRRVLSRMSF
jgi:hypothetical protein